MSRRAPHFTGEKAAVANTYVEATNMLDLGASADPHHVKFSVSTAVAKGEWLYVVASPTAIAVPATPLADAAQRIRIFAPDEALSPAAVFEHTFNFGVRFLYFLSGSSTIDVSVVADENE